MRSSLVDWGCVVCALALSLIRQRFGTMWFRDPLRQATTLSPGLVEGRRVCGEIWRNLAWEGRVLGSRVPRSSVFLVTLVQTLWSKTFSASGEHP